MTIARILSAALLGLALTASATAFARAPQAAPGAHFTVTDTVVAPRPPAITATVNAIGAGARFMQNGGFEPAVERSRLTPLADAPNRIVLDESSATRSDSMREGVLDGAEVAVYRVIDGEMRLVRTDRVARGGHAATGWIEQTGTDRAIPADRREAAHVWRRWNRPDAPMWITVRAVGEGGALSPPAAPLRVVSPSKPGNSRESTDYAPFNLRPGGAAPDAPRNLRIASATDDELHLAWDAPEGGAEIIGWRLQIARAAPEAHRGFFLDLEGRAATPEQEIREGDMVFVKVVNMDYSRSRNASDRIWNANSARQQAPAAAPGWPDEGDQVRSRLMPHDPVPQVANPGASYLELEVPRGGRGSVGVYNHASTAQDYYDVLAPGRYKVSVWLRADRTGTAAFQLRGPLEKDVAQVPIPYDTEWRLVEREFSVPRIATEDGQVGRMELIFQDPGRYDIDNLRIWPADEDYLRFDATDRARLADARVEVLRTHALVRTGRVTYDLAQFTNGGGAISGVKGGNTLPQTLDAFARVGIDPWLQVEPHFSDAEWLGLVEFLAAPANAGPWATKRVGQGRGAPWTDAFGKIYIELGNETWNRLFEPWTFPRMIDASTGQSMHPGKVYGMFQERVIGVLRSSPWWAAAGLDDKVEFVIGGRNGGRFGMFAAEASPSSRHMTVAAYNGGWDAKAGPPDGSPASFFRVMTTVEQAMIPKARQHAEEARALSKTLGHPVAAGTYEAGPGYALNGMMGLKVSPEQGEAQEHVMKSQAAGVAALDAFLAQAQAGYWLQNFFTFDEGRRFTSHAMWFRGGQAYPSWKLIALLNREGLGDLLEVGVNAAPTADLKKAVLRQAVDDAPLISVYATRDGDRLNVFVLSRETPFYPDKDDDGCTPVTVDLPISGAARLTVHRMAGPPDAHNVTSDAVKIEVEALPVPVDPAHLVMGADTGAPACGLPPSSAFLYVFEGVSG
jgi:hypothetical protein